MYTSVILLPEDGLWNKSKVLAMNLRTFYLALKFITHLCLLRPFGNIIKDLAQVHDGQLSIAELRKLERLCTKIRKAELDLQF